MRPPFLKQRPRSGGHMSPESGSWIWYIIGLLTLLWLLYSWYFEN
ncbi:MULTISPECIES: hypothetical protein [Hymenobacter]